MEELDNTITYITSADIDPLDDYVFNDVVLTGNVYANIAILDELISNSSVTLSQTGNADFGILTSESANVINLQSDNANVINLITQSANVVSLLSDSANLINLTSQSANVVSLLSDSANLINLTSQSANVVNLVSDVLQVGNLTSQTSVNFANASLIDFGTIDTVKISGGSEGYVLFTDGSGNLSWSNNLIYSWNTANAAFVQANTPSVTANAAFIQANAAFVQANAAFVQANTPSVTANAAFIQANAAFIQANAAFVQANSAFDKANTDVTNISITAGTYGNTTSIPVITLAANGRISSISNAQLVAATSNYANTAASANFANVANAAVITNVTTGTYYPVITDTTITGAESLNYSSNDFQMYAANNTFRATGNVWAGNYITIGTSNIPVVNTTGHWVGQSISSLDQFGRNTANAAFRHANAAFEQANTGGGGGGGTITTKSPIYVDTFTANGDSGYSGNSYTLTTETTSDYVIVNINGITQLKSAYGISGNQIIFTDTPKVNSVIQVTTFQGTFLQSGNNRTYIGNNIATSFGITTGYTTTKLIVTLNGLVQEPSVDYYVSGSTLIFTTAPQTGVKIGILELPESSDNGIDNYARTKANNSFDSANGAFDVANVAYVMANTDVTNISITAGTYGNTTSIPVITLAANGRIVSVSNSTTIAVDQYSRNTANASFIQANTPSLTANAAFVQANAAFVQANAAFVQANTPSVTANAAFVQANAAFVQANAAFVQANAAFVQANTPSVTANAAFVQANAAYEQANASFIQANTLSVTANAAFVQANAAYEQANTPSVTANAAFVQANAAYGQANTAFAQVDAAFVQANAAFNKANTSTVTLDGQETLTNKTFTGYTETVYTLGTSGTLSLSPTNGTIQTTTLVGNVTFTDDLLSGQSLILRMSNGSSYTVTWPTITWVSSVGNFTPTLTNKDVLVFWKISSTLYGAYLGSYQ